jgi:hypothetical protein
MENENETPELVEEEVEETPEEETQQEEGDSTEETTDWEAKAKELEGRNKRLKTKLEKATQDKPKPIKAGELDFGQLAFHNSKTDALKIESEEDIDFLKETMADTGKTQEALLKSKWFMAELKEKKEATQKTIENKRAIPTNSRRSVPTGTDNLDYWMKQPFEKVPQNIRGKVLARRVAEENTPFSFE